MLQLILLKRKEIVEHAWTGWIFRRFNLGSAFKFGCYFQPWVRFLILGRLFDNIDATFKFKLCFSGSKIFSQGIEPVQTEWLKTKSLQKKQRFISSETAQNPNDIRGSNNACKYFKERY